MLLTWKLAPALAAGCTVVIKPSDHTPVSTLALAAPRRRGRVPARRLQRRDRAGDRRPARRSSSHPGVDKVAFTGSTKVGRLIAHAAADNLTRSSLELGGKSAQLVFADADLDAAANGIVAGVFAATGQTCMAGSRVLVHADVARRARRAGRRARPHASCSATRMLAETEMGPVANQRAVRHGHAAPRVRPRRRAPPSRTAAGRTPQLGGLFVQPTVLTDADAGRCGRARGDLRPGASADHGLRATRTRPSPSPTAPSSASPAAVWTSDVRRAHRVAAALRRRHGLDQRLPRGRRRSVPFGGFGLSGMGPRERRDASHEYTETKAVWVELSGATRDPFVLG